MIFPPFLQYFISGVYTAAGVCIYMKKIKFKAALMHCTPYPCHDAGKLI
jgi:hypothetical protein